MLQSKTPRSKYLQICILTLLVNLYLVSHTEAGLPFGASVFPLLTSGWYPKPAPKEALLLGLALVQILALKFAASAAGVPYHLNDIKLDHFFDKKYFRRGKRSNANSILAQLSNPDLMTAAIQSEEFAVLERVLLALRRIDSHDCFIRYICQASQNRLGQNATTFSDAAFDDFWIDLFRLRPKQKRMNYDEPSVWNIYEEALKPQPMDCNKKYEQCPLTEKDLTKTSLLSTFF